jgi:outer membrane protein assembly factor BamB
MTPGGPLAVSNQMLFVGTQGSVDQPETSALYVINTQNGSLRWYKLMGDYVGTAFLNNVAYVSSRDQYLYALNMNNGTVLWRHKFIYPVYNPALAVNGILYINIDGAYALDSTNGSVLWYKPLGTSQSVDFIPSVVVDGVDYLASTDGQGNSTLYALNASTGAEYWHISNLNQISPLVVV